MLAQPCRRFRTVLVWRVWTLGVLGAVLAITLAARAAAQCGSQPCPPSVGGQWSAVYDYTTQLACENPHYGASDLSAAALLPAGLHRGKVLLWREACPESGNRTYETYLFDPADLDDLIRIDHPPLYCDLFCSGFSWGPAGSLFVTGGNPTQFTGTAVWTHLFHPGALGEIQELGGKRTVKGDFAWQRIGDMNDPRYYAGVMTLNRRELGPAPNFAGGGQFVVGGTPGPWQPVPEPTYNSQTQQCDNNAGNHGNSGTQFWQHADSVQGVWDQRVHAPAGGSDPNGPGIALRYDRIDQGGAIVTGFGNNDHPRADILTYPRMFQFADLDPFTQHPLFIAHDLLAFATSRTWNNAGLSWLIRPPTATQPLWQLQDATHGLERYYGTAGFAHTRTTSITQNRLIVFGGARNLGTTDHPNWQIVVEVQEFVPGANPAQGSWVTKQTGLIDPRIMANVVILPTGEFAIMGGGTSVGPCDAGPGSPVFTPELYRIGNPNGTGASTVQMNATNIHPSHPSGQRVPRLYHSLAVLLADGRVLLAGGENVLGSPPSGKTGEVFSPPYMFQGTRPSILSGTSEVSFSTPAAPVGFGVTVSHEHPIDRVVLLRPASVTHAFDTDQRYIELPFLPGPSSGVTRFSVTSPTEDLGPPGWYMLFVVQNGPQGRVPSIAWWVHLT